MTVMRALLATLLLLALPLAAAEDGAAEASAGTPAAAATDQEGAAADADSPAAAADQATDGAEAEAEVVEGTPFFDKLKQGGVIIVILLFISVALVSFTIERFTNLKREALIPAGFVGQARDLWKAKDYKGLRALCDARPSTLARVVRVLVMHRKSTPMELSQLSSDVASQDVRHHMQKLIPFALVATISPLLGLLGTIIGMIGAFETVEVAGELGDASILAGDISKALITTAGGLVVAVPAIALFNWFKSRTARLAIDLDEAVNELISEWFIEETDDEGEAADAAGETASRAEAQQDEQKAEVV